MLEEGLSFAWKPIFLGEETVFHPPEGKKKRGRKCPYY